MMWNVLVLLYLLIGVGIAWGAMPNVKLEISGAQDRQARTRRLLYGVMFLNTALTWPLTAAVGIFMGLTPSKVHAETERAVPMTARELYAELAEGAQLPRDQRDQVRVLYEKTALPALTLSALASLYEYKEKELKKEGASRKQIITVLGLELSHAAPSLTAAEIQLIEDARTFGVDAIREAAH